MKLQKFSIAAAIAIASVQVFAAEPSSKFGLMVEPSLTYELGSSTTNYPSPLSSATGNINGLGLGARIGFHLSEAFFLGVDGRYSMPQYKDSSVSYDAKAVATNWGPVVGIQMPEIGLRAWGAVILGGELDPEKSGNFDVAFKKATGVRIGAGFRVSAVSLNVEYQDLKYGDTVLEQVGPFTSGSSLSSVNMSNKTWIVGLSFPLEL
jgi:Outer membrane protein beta-barrel domain